MIVWLNGAFGAGKTTICDALRTVRPELRWFDPEYVGYVLRHFVDVPSGDFQDLALWRRLVVEHLTGLVDHHRGTWLVPMTMLNPAYRAEIFDGIRGRGVPICQIVLSVPEDVLRARIDADTADPGAREWRHDHVAAALSELTGLSVREPGTVEVDNTRPPAAVVEEILRLVRVPA